MFQKDPVLIQLKHQLHPKIPRVKGTVKAIERGFGFLEVDAQKSYFIPPIQMKKVMHGDRISAVIHTYNKRKFAEPEKLIEPFLTRFVGNVYKKEDDHLSIIPDYPFLKNGIPCYTEYGIKHNFKDGDWAVAEMCCHPLNNKRGFCAKLTQFITHGNDTFIPWLVTLARYNLEKEAPSSSIEIKILEEDLERLDLTMLDFFTIDGASTEDMDDALYIEEDNNGKLYLTVAISDPTAWIAEGSQLDNFAKVRAFSSYLPNFNIPMLPRKLSDNLCSLRPDTVRKVLVCRMNIESDGTINSSIEFFAAIMRSRAKLTYNNVSDWLDNTGNWRPESESIATQIRLLYHFYLRRSKWRSDNALVLKNRTDYRFIFSKKGEILDIIAEPRRIANRIIEESMIAANFCAARMLRDKLGFGIYNVNTGFDPRNTKALIAILKAHGIYVNSEEILTLEGFRKLYQEINTQQSDYLNNRIRRFQSFTKISTEPGPHFGLGFDVYATWTSPIRRYGDMVNHRLLKAIMKGEMISPPHPEIIIQIIERRRLNRMAERDVEDWLYASFLNNKVGTTICFSAEIINVNNSGIRVRLVNNGAIANIPTQLLHSVRDELVCSQEEGYVEIKGKAIYKITDMIKVIITEVCMKTRSITARPVHVVTL